MIDGAIRLLAKRGLQATSFSEVLALTGAPRGSIYHHFPEGKDQLIGAVLFVAPGDLDRIAGVPQLEKVNPFDHPATVHIETGDNALGEHKKKLLVVGC